MSTSLPGFPTPSSATGLPTLPASTASLYQSVAPVTADAVSALVAVGIPKWGLYDQNYNPVVIASNVVSFEYRREWKLPNYPIEQGGFVDYDKVTMPYDVKLTFSQGGSVAERAAFLNNIETIGASLNLYNAVTPEKTYLNQNVNRLGYSRKADHGAGMIVVEFGLTEIRESAAATYFTATAQPNGSNQVNTGVQQAQTPTPAQEAQAVNSGILPSFSAPGDFVLLGP